MENKQKLVRLFQVLAVVLVLVGMAGVAKAAVALDDTITPQNCSRLDASCAKFVDTSSTGQIKWGAFIAGGLRSLTNLFVDGKMAIGSLIVSTGQQPLRLDVNGAVGAKYYCDDNGNNCVAGNALGNGNGTSTGLTSLTLNSGNGITVSPNTFNSSNTTGTISIDTSYTQKRVAGTCEGANAIKKINVDGTVVCQPAGTGTGSVNLRAGTGITLSPSPITSDGLISADFNSVQRRLAASCPAGQAIQGIDAVGKATCVTTSGTGTGIPSGVAGQTLRFSGNNTLGVSTVLFDNGANLGVGTANPTEKLEVNGRTKTTSLQVTAYTDLFNAEIDHLRIVGIVQPGQVLTAVNASGDVAWKDPVTSPSFNFWTGSLNGNINSANAGNVGIGVASPTAKLEVAGLTKVGSLQVDSNANVAGRMSAGSLKIGSNSTAGQVLTAIDASGNATWQNPSSLPGDISGNFKFVRKLSYVNSNGLTLTAKCPVGYAVMACTGTLSNCEEDSCGYHGAVPVISSNACEAYFDTADSGYSRSAVIATCVKGSAIANQE